MNAISDKKNIKCFLLILLCFLWTSCGYLSWVYRLASFLPAPSVDLASEVVGYLFQALGLLCFSLYVRRRPEAYRGRFFARVIAADLLFILPSVLARSLMAALIFGYGMNLLHGVVAGYYLYRLAAGVSPRHRGMVLGLSYGGASIISWLLSLFGNGNFLRSGTVLIVYAVLTALTAGLVLRDDGAVPVLPVENAPSSLHDGSVRDALTALPEGTPPARPTAPVRDGQAARLIALAEGTVFLLSLIKGLGFAFPFADLGSGVSLELSRVLYAVGLVIAGMIGDRDRRYAAVCCMASLGFPFLMTALSGELGPSIAVWMLNYFFFGFFTIFRVILFSDLTDGRPAFLYLSGWGLLFGRLGDAAGAYGCIRFSAFRPELIATETVLFAAAILLFFLLYQRLYAPPVRERSAQERFDGFSDGFGLSAREREVLRLLLDERSNPEMAAQLFVSESTVKFHVHNILKKTGCENRVLLLALYRKGAAQKGQGKSG